MTTPVYTSPFTGTVVTPTDVSYLALPFSANVALFWPSIVNDSQTPAARIIDCTPSTSGLSIALPEGNQGTLGADILFRNLGSSSFLVTDYTSGNSVPIAAGASHYFYLTDNTTPAGVWHNVTFGTGTSSADAASLAGPGLTTVNGTLAVYDNTIDVSVNTTVPATALASTYIWNSGAGTLTLPENTSIFGGWWIGFRNNGTGALILAPVTPTAINNQQSIVANPGDSGFIIYDGVGNQYITVGLTAPSTAVFTAATYDVDAISGNALSLTSFAPIIQTYVAQSGTRTTNLNVTLPAITQIYILVNNTNQTSYDILFKNQGSSSPPLVLPAGSVVTVLSDGINLYTLTSASTGLYYAANGSAGVPAYSFNSDTTTGMYLISAGILGFSANGILMLTIDDSNVLAPVITTPAVFTALGGIAGGTF
jgi:hypothetical protein